MSDAKNMNPESAAPQPGRRGRPRVFDRNAALDTAMKLFWVKGYEATSIADLTSALGIGPTSLYAAFGSKEQLYAEALNLYSTTYEHLVLGGFRSAATAREAVAAYLWDSAAAMTGSDCGLPHGCLVTLGAVGGDEHAALGDLMRTTRGGAYDILLARLERAVQEGELPPSLDIAFLARYLQTVQSGMAIRARDGASREELQAVAKIAMTSWDGMVQASLPG
ncbi:AcrR family transcriptional regulator [Duganella sp. 1224]|uniref:TetR/AcrR family transcriptional regulator n=1 Tax=Duganella sp. 1224 TaxID=2587052 RepID=UPI0017BA653E|nr:TetR/AcrR family transcriptional regulator [Duganella sp. 1224]NYE60613.1 AcrR family transcriptional regulator [Duganella sp. 1224]